MRSGRVFIGEANEMGKVFGFQTHVLLAVVDKRPGEVVWPHLDFLSFRLMVISVPCFLYFLFTFFATVCSEKN